MGSPHGASRFTCRANFNYEARIVMAVREFTDSAGKQWRAWDVAPDELNPRTKDEDYLAQLYFTGWIVFEAFDGGDKRRLYPIPRGWDQLPEPELEVLLRKAEIVPKRKLRSEKEARGEAAAEEMQRAADFGDRAIEEPEAAREQAREETPDVTDLNVLRTFRYPGGRIWVAGVIQHPEDGTVPVLRFAAGSRTIDLRDWPKDWVDYPDDALVQLLRRAAPRAPGSSAPDAPRRRWDDEAR
jgi:hypothetical protein